MKTCSAHKLNHGRSSLSHYIGPPKPSCANYERDLNWRIFFLFGPRLFGAHIKLRVISKKILFYPHRFCWRERKRKYVSQWQTARSKWKWTSIASVPDLCPTTVKILTHLISRYHLPLRQQFFLPFFVVGSETRGRKNSWYFAIQD